MIYSTLLLASSAVIGLVTAQNASFPVNGPYTIDPNSIPIENRTSWCNAQQGNCPLVCGGRANLDQNLCDATTLNYTCTCTGGNQPNISSFANMIPSYECIQWVMNCVTAAGNNLNSLTDCRSVACGSRDPGAVPQSGGNGGGSSPSSSAAPSSSASPTSNGNGNGGGSPSSSASASATSTGAAVALGVAREYGTPILAAGMLGLFGLAL